MIISKKALYIFFIFLFSLSSFLQGQTNVISSKSAYILIRNDTTFIADNDFTTPLPFSIVFPRFDNKRLFTTNVNQINIIGKIKNPGKTAQLFLNHDEVKFSSEGLFFKVIDLSPGENILRIKVIPSNGKTMIVNFFITYQSGEL